MIRICRIVPVLSVVLLTAVIVPPAGAQNAGQTASQFYMAYRTAFDKAQKIDDLMPYMSKKSRGQVEATPVAERAEMFGFLKMVGALTNVKILKETKTSDGVTLTVEALDPDRQKTAGTIEIVKEDGAWKLDGESWSSAS